MSDIEAAKARWRSRLAQEQDRAASGRATPLGEILPLEARDLEGPSDPELQALYQSALEAADDGALEIAEENLRRLLHRSPQYRPALRELGYLLLNQLEFLAALQTGEALGQLAPEDLDGLRIRALALDRLEDPRAGPALEELLAHLPETAPRARTQATLLRDRWLDGNRPQEGADGSEARSFRANRLGRCTKASDHPPAEEAARTVYDQALGALEQRDPEGAEALFWKAIALSPEDPASYRELGILAFEANDFEEAQRTLGRALELGDPSLDTPRALGLSRDRLGDAEGAQEALEIFLERCPPEDHQRAQVAAQRTLERLRETGAEPTPQVQALEDIEELSPKNPWLHPGLGLALGLFFWALWPGSEEPRRRAYAGTRGSAPVLELARSVDPGFVAIAEDLEDPDRRPLVLAELYQVLFEANPPGLAAALKALFASPNPDLSVEAVAQLEPFPDPVSEQILTGILFRARDARDLRASTKALEILSTWQPEDWTLTLLQAREQASRRKNRHGRFRPYLNLLDASLEARPKDELFQAFRDLVEIKRANRGEAHKRSKEAMQRLARRLEVPDALEGTDWQP